MKFSVTYIVYCARYSTSNESLQQVFVYMRKMYEFIEKKNNVTKSELIIKHYCTYKTVTVELNIIRKE